MLGVGFAADILALRLSYVGELGWELYIPNEVSCALHYIIVMTSFIPDRSVLDMAFSMGQGQHNDMG